MNEPFPYHYFFPHETDVFCLKLDVFFMIFHTLGIQERQAWGKQMCLWVSKNAATDMCAYVCARKKKQKSDIRQE